MPGQLSQQDGQADITPRIERADDGLGKIHLGMIGDGANHQEGQALSLGDTTYGPAFHVEGDVPAGLMQISLVGPGADDIAAFTNRHHML